MKKLQEYSLIIIERSAETCAEVLGEIGRDDFIRWLWDNYHK